MLKIRVVNNSVYISDSEYMDGKTYFMGTFILGHNNEYSFDGRFSEASASLQDLRLIAYELDRINTDPKREIYVEVEDSK